MKQIKFLPTLLFFFAANATTFAQSKVEADIRKAYAALKTAITMLSQVYVQTTSPSWVLLLCLLKALGTPLSNTKRFSSAFPDSGYQYWKYCSCGQQSLLPGCNLDRHQHRSFHGLARYRKIYPGT